MSTVPAAGDSNDQAGYYKERRKSRINPKLIPKELRDLAQWVVWRLKNRDGRWTKVPYRARNSKVGAKTNDPKTWDTFERAMAAFLADDSLDGIGFVFAPDGGFAGIDLDNCRSPDGSVAEWARPILERFKGGWAAVSPSGQGIKIVVKGSLGGEEGTRRTGFGLDGKGAVEIYDRRRFFTTTTDVLDVEQSTIGGEHSAELGALYADLKLRAKEADRPAGALTPVPSADVLSVDDGTLLDKIRQSRQGAKFAALYDAGDTSAYHGDASAADHALCCILAFWCNKDAARIERLFAGSRLAMREKWGRADYRERTIAAACEATTETYTPERRNKQGETAKAAARVPSKGAAEDRPDIEITTKRHEVVAQAVASLPRDPTLYHRCQRLVTVVEDVRTRVKITRRTAIRQQERTPRIVELSASVIGLALTRNADWFQWKKDPKGEPISVSAHPPDWAIKAVETIGHWPGVRFLRAVAEAPFIRPDGTVAAAPGYDPDTETLLIPSGVFPEIPSKPTRADAKAAAAKLFKLVDQFPFVNDNHKWVWLAALLSVMGRPAITGPCPGFVFDANVAGTGKTLLATIIGLIASGRDVATVGYPQDPAEMGKIVTSVALAGYPVVLLDNVPNGSKFGNDQLDRALTSTVVDGRELGKSRMVGMLDLSSIWVLTGNNVSPTGDSFRRWLIGRIESPLERPDRRDDLAIPDLSEYVREHRGELVAAVLTILRAHAVAEWPSGKWAPIGSYAAWERVVRGAVWFATDGGDCCATQDELAVEDPERLERAALAEGWLELPGGNTGLTSGEALELVKDDAKLDKPLQKHDGLRSVFLEWGSKGELASTRTIGNRLKAIKGQIIGMRKFATAGEIKRATRWKVVSVGGESGESGESGSQASARESRTNSHVMACSENGKSPEESPGSTHQTHQTHQPPRWTDPNETIWPGDAWEDPR
jgi:hypothetical protein